MQWHTANADAFVAHAPEKYSLEEHSANIQKTRKSTTSCAAESASNMCYAPIPAWRSKTRNKTGKRSLVFKLSEGYADMPVQISCGQCYECRLQKAREWAMRCNHEASLYIHNCFVTLTYDDEHLPTHGTLVPSHLTKFLKDLRQWLRYRLTEKGKKVNESNRIRFFGCGEYGDLTARPHYHLLLFNFDFLDKQRYATRDGYPVYESPTLNNIWAKGRAEIGSVTFQSAAYCARYIMKKYTSKDPDKVKQHYGPLEPEFCRMSRRPGIGTAWYELHKDGIYKHDSIIVNGKEMKPPRFYDQLFEAVNPNMLRNVKCQRKNRITEEQTHPQRVLARAKIAASREKLYQQEKI